MGELKALHIMCKRDTESVEVAPESVQSITGECRRYTLDQVSAGEGIISGGGGGYLRTPARPAPCVLQLALRRF